MARIAGVDLPRNKRMEIALTYIFGIGRVAVERDPRQGGRRPQQEERRSRPTTRWCKLRQVDRSELQGRRRPAPRDRDEHQAPHGPRLLPRPAPPAQPAGARPAHAHQRAHPQGAAPGHRRQEEGAAEGRERRQGACYGQEQAHRDRRREAAANARRSRRASSATASCTSTRRSTTRIVTITDQWATCSPGRAPARCGFKGSRKGTPFAAQLAAEAAAKKAMEHGCATCRCYVKGPGAGRESALRALQAPGFTITIIRDVTPDSAQRLPAAQAPPRLGRSRRMQSIGTLYRSRLSALPARRPEALPQGRALLHGQVRHRAPQLPARPARPGPRRSSPSTAAAAREAEGQAHVRRARAPVPPLLRDGRALARHHRRDAAPAARAPARQHGLPDGLRDLARRGAPAGAPRPLHGQRPQGEHPVVPGASRAT